MTTERRGAASSLPRSGCFAVAPEWIDLYGHMNASRYFSVFVDEGYALTEVLGLGQTYTQESKHGIFAVNAHVQYRMELKAGTPVHVRIRVLGVDRLRLLVLMELVDESRGDVAATLEQLTVHVSLVTRKATSFPEAVRRRVEDLARQHASIDLPAGYVRYLHCRPAAASLV